MKLIETKTLATAASLIEFTSIPQNFTDLILLISARSSINGVADGLRVRFNNNASGYSSTRLYVFDSTTGSDTNTGGDFILNGALSTANFFSSVQYYIPNYRVSTDKAYLSDGVGATNSSTRFIGMTAGRWSNTQAISSLVISSENGANITANSTASLYGITKGSDGITTVS
jgi:hypothetical protein